MIRLSLCFLLMILCGCDSNRSSGPKVYADKLSSSPGPDQATFTKDKKFNNLLVVPGEYCGDYFYQMDASEKEQDYSKFGQHVLHINGHSIEFVPSEPIPIENIYEIPDDENGKLHIAIDLKDSAQIGLESPDHTAIIVTKINLNFFLVEWIDMKTTVTTKKLVCFIK